MALCNLPFLSLIEIINDYEECCQYGICDFCMNLIVS